MLTKIDSINSMDEIIRHGWERTPDEFDLGVDLEGRWLDVDDSPFASKSEEENRNG